MSFFLIPFAIAVVGIVSLVGCSQVEKLFGRRPIEDRKRVEIHSHDHIGTPIVYPLEDPDCSRGDALSDIGVARVWLDRKTASGKFDTVLEEVDLSGVSGIGLTSEFSRGVLIDVKSHYGDECRIESGTELKVTCKHKEFAVNNGRQINICRSGGYRRNSLENVALASIYGLKKAFLLHQRLDPALVRKKSLPKITILVHPVITITRAEKKEGIDELVDDQVTQVLTDDAIFEHGKPENLYVAFLPNSLELGRDLIHNIWEMSAVGAHEYGHLIFYSYAPDLHNLGMKARKAIGSLNEAFADLVAFAAFNVGYDPLGALHIGDDGWSRNVLKPFYESGEPKRLDQRFFEGEELLLPIHYTGATLAYALRKLYVGALGRSEANAQSVANTLMLKIVRLLVFLDTEARRATVLRDKALLEMVLRWVCPPDASQCSLEDVQSLFPALTYPPEAP